MAFALTPKWGRFFLWGLAFATLLLPLVAMRFTDEVNWTARDFASAAMLIGGLGLAIEMAVRVSPDRLWRIITIAVAIGAFGAIWIDLAVGLNRDEPDPRVLLAGLLPMTLALLLFARTLPRKLALFVIAFAAGQLAVALLAPSLFWPLMMGVTGLTALGVARRRPAQVDPKARRRV